jgi:hypothetical protein
LGTWTSQDPLQYINGVNTYQFVMSNPVGNVDPIGEAHAGSGGGDRHDRQWDNKKRPPSWQQRGNRNRDAQKKKQDRKNKGRTPHYLCPEPPPVDIVEGGEAGAEAAEVVVDIIIGIAAL